jgi:proteasome accessory factor A
VNRIVGLETEYGCLCDDPAGPAAAVGRVRNWVFDQGKFGLTDLHQRDWDEPAGNGGFLFNGGRCYVDMGHLELCTPECVDLRDLILYDRVGDHLISTATADLGMSGKTTFVRNNIDYHSGATFGCHENYLLRRAAPLREENVQSLLTFLTLRVLYTGAGRVRATPSAESRPESLAPWQNSDFQLSQRADFINNDLFEWVQFNRAIINTRDEPLADARKYRRLHLLHGDTSVLPATLAAKIGTTSLVLDLLEIDQLPKLALTDAVMTFRNLSHAPNGPWLVPLTGGRCRPALEILRLYHDLAAAEFRDRDEETNQVLALWKRALEGLESDPESLVGTVDWITKQWLFRQFVAAENLSWDDPWLQAQDLEYHSVDPDRNLSLSVAQTPPEWSHSDDELTAAQDTPPANTRAAARSSIMRALENQDLRYFVDWEVIDAEGVNSLSLLDPFDPKPPEIGTWMRRMRAAAAEGRPEGDPLDSNK